MTVSKEVLDGLLANYKRPEVGPQDGRGRCPLAGDASARGIVARLVCAAGQTPGVASDRPPTPETGRPVGVGE